MLSVAAVRSAAGAAQYFAKDDYYTAEGSAERSEWGGAGAESLGLSGPVDKTDFENTLTGRLPSGEGVGQVERRQAGTDLTFSMPKSASILAYVAGDERVLAANLAAVRATMQWVERNLAEGRKDVEGRKVPIRTGNLVYALFQHDTSRALDPQGHAHAVIANLTRMPDGRMQALHNGAIWRANTVIGSVYHAQLRHNLEELGYRTERAGKHGAFEVAGVPREVIEAFSVRREAILAKAAELGLASPQARDGIAITTRDPKLNMTDRETLHTIWRERAAALGFGGEVLTAAAKARSLQAGARPLERGYRAIVNAVATTRQALSAMARPHDPLIDRGLARTVASPAEARAQLATASAIRILSQHEAAIGRREIVKAALDLGLSGVTADQVEARVSTLLHRGQLLPEASVRHDGAIDLVTTPAALRTEQAILDLMAAGKGTGRAILPADETTGRLRALSERPLNAGQRAAATLIIAGSDRAVVVQGVAGAGKSTLLQAVARVAEGEGRQVLGLAFQNRMVADLASGAGIESRTLAAFLQTHEPAIERQGQDLAVARASLANTILVVDEASMVSSDDMLRLHRAAAALHIEKLVLVGDRQQLASIDAGKAFALIQVGGAATARMDENLRQRTPQLRTVAALANRGAAGVAVGALGDAVIEHAEPAREAASRWLSLSEPDRARTAIFASGRSMRAAINQFVQQGLVEEGRLGTSPLRLIALERVNLTREEMRFSGSYRAGQVLEVARPIPSVGLSRGRYDVLGEDGRGRIELSQGSRRIRFDPQRLPIEGGRPALELAERKTLDVHIGDAIRWTANDRTRGLHNSALARVVEIGKPGVVIETAAEDRVTLKPGDPMLERIDLAYSLNMHMAQGITTDRAITVMLAGERHLANQRLFNVGVTRVRDQLTLIVDDKAKLVRRLDMNSGNKTSALETLGQLDIDGRRRSSSPVTPDSHVGSGRDRSTASSDSLQLPPIDALPPLPERSLSLDL